MTEHLTGTHWEQRFRPAGPGRFLTASFLGVWLCFWAAGEVFVLAVLATGVWALATGRPPPNAAQPLALGPALAVAAFLLAWLAFWTLGGVAAIRELLRALWAEDHLALGPQGLKVSRRLGPFRSSRVLAWEKIRRVFLQPRKQTLMAETGTASVELTSLGTVAERQAAASALRQALQLTQRDAATVPDAPPEGWEEILVLRGGTVLVPHLRTRQRQAQVVSFLAAAACVGTLLLIWESLRDVNLWALTAMAVVVTGALSWSALWLWQGREEWAIERGRLVLQKRFGFQVTVLGEARALELTERRDGDGDGWYELVAVGSAAPALLAKRGSWRVGRAAEAAQGRFVITRALHDCTEPRRLGLWLARRAEIPLTDRVPDEAARRAELVRLREALVRTGPVGRFLARVAERATPPEQSG